MGHAEVMLKINWDQREHWWAAGAKPKETVELLLHITITQTVQKKFQTQQSNVIFGLNAFKC